MGSKRIPVQMYMHRWMMDAVHTSPSIASVFNSSLV